MRKIPTYLISAGVVLGSIGRGAFYLHRTLLESKFMFAKLKHFIG